MSFKQINYKPISDIANMSEPLADVNVLGFTGAKNGMTEKQYLAAIWFVDLIKHKKAVHGDCVGADAQFHDIVRDNSSAKVEIFPALNPNYRANKKGDIIHEPKPALERDKIMAQMAEVMLATPPTKEEILRSGTWATVRYARKSPSVKLIIIISPDGEYAKEEF